MDDSTVKSLEYLEIEYKYRANWISEEDFIKKCKELNPYRTLEIYGPDTYYENSNGQVIRWRHSDDTDELTVKYRTSNRTSLIRKEIDLKLEGNHVKTTLTFIKSLGLEKLFRIYKDCKIFWFNSEKGSVSVVFYTVYAKNRYKRSFIEIEVDKNQNMSISQAKELVKYWEQQLGLKSAQRINTTLLELYSEKQTKLLQEQTGKQLCYNCLELLDISNFYSYEDKKTFTECKSCVIQSQNTEEKRLKMREYWNSTKEDRAKASKKWREKNKAKILKNNAQYVRLKREEDISFKLKCNLRSRLYQALTRKKKLGSSIKDLGCSVEELRTYIESKFYNHPETNIKMDWNYWGAGEDCWQIDHIEPLHKFNLEKEEEFKKAVHYTNLQPLWYVDHLKKTKEDIKGV